MTLEWLDASEATKIGVELADQFAPRQVEPAAKRDDQSPRTDDLVQAILRRADREVRGMRLNFYKKAKFANSFKWRLLENGVDRKIADAVTQRLVMHLAANQSASSALDQASNGRHVPVSNTKTLFAQGNKHMAEGRYLEATEAYRELLRIDQRHVAGFNNLGAALFKLGQYEEADEIFNKVIRMDPHFPDGYSNLGNSLIFKGRHEEAEGILRRAVKLNPRLLEARVNLGLTLTLLGRTKDAKTHMSKALKSEPRNADALHAMALVARAKGDFEAANALIDRALKVNPNMPAALAARSGLGKMTSSDAAWLERAEKVADGGLDPMSESEMRFAIGKYHDDVGDYKRAFGSYKRGNDLLKPLAEPYDREGRKNFVDMMIRVYAREVVESMSGGASNSAKPIFVVGMPRSGTSLTEQIIASHPSAKGAGELMFWSRAIHEHAAAVEKGPLGESTRSKLAEAYLNILKTSGDALRVVDKAPVNADYLGVIHSVFPNARIIYMQRDPIDACLSCYFQKFVLSMNFTTDLSDLAYYFRQHERLVAHWRAVLPAGTILEVPYEELIADQAGWSRKILDFVGLEWNEKCLDFHTTPREVITASYWQVRQKIYSGSVQRWRRYEKFIGPLLNLKT
jgi:tetratricopeptide (TPR) repeat protein